MKGTLYLIPTPLGDSPVDKYLSPVTKGIIASLSYFIAEDIKMARRFIKKVIPDFSFDQVRFGVLNEHTHIHEIDHLLQPVEEGMTTGLLSDAGCPAIADPGAELVALAHQRGIAVKPLIGPSSVLLGLMASGMNGQNFSFCGYLPKDRRERIKKLKDLEKQSRALHQTQIFIETPYRNQHLLDDILSACSPATQLCTAIDLSLPEELIISKPIREWKKSSIEVKDRQVVFVMYCSS